MFYFIIFIAIIMAILIAIDNASSAAKKSNEISNYNTSSFYKEAQDDSIKIGPLLINRISKNFIVDGYLNKENWYKTFNINNIVETELVVVDKEETYSVAESGYESVFFSSVQKKKLQKEVIIEEIYLKLLITGENRGYLRIFFEPNKSSINIAEDVIAELKLLKDYVN